MSTSRRPSLVCRTASCHHHCTLLQWLRSVWIGFFVCFKPSHFNCVSTLLGKHVNKYSFSKIVQRSGKEKQNINLGLLKQQCLYLILSWELLGVIISCVFRSLFLNCGQLLVSVPFSLSFAAISSFITYVFLASHATFLDTNEIDLQRFCGGGWSSSSSTSCSFSCFCFKKPSSIRLQGKKVG